MDMSNLYFRVLQVVNYFLESSSHISVAALKDFDPTVNQLAKSLRVLATILKDLAGESYEDQDMAINAFQCVLIMEQIANLVGSVDDNCEQQLELLVKSLEGHAKAPVPVK